MVAKSRKVFWAEIGAKQPNYFSTDRTCTVLYGVLRYGTVITVKKAEVQRILTSLITMHTVMYGVYRYTILANPNRDTPSYGLLGFTLLPDVVTLLLRLLPSPLLRSSLLLAWS